VQNKADAANLPDASAFCIGASPKSR